MNKEDLILIGAGGHCRSCIDVIETEGRFHITGIVDIEEKLHQKILEYEVISTDKDLPHLCKKYQCFFIAIGSIKDPTKRIEKYEVLKNLGAILPIIISPLAYVARSVSISEGTIVMHQALINSNVTLGKNCIINSKVLVEHDSIVGDHCHISTGSIVNGTCNIGNRVFIGSNSVVVNNVNIVDDVIIGAGSVIMHSINKAGLYIGNPAHKCK